MYVTVTLSGTCRATLRMLRTKGALLSIPVPEFSGPQARVCLSYRLQRIHLYSTDTGSIATCIPSLSNFFWTIQLKFNCRVMLICF